MVGGVTLIYLMVVGGYVISGSLWCCGRGLLVVWLVVVMWLS